MDTKTLTVGDLQTTDTLDACKKLCDDKPLCKAYQYNAINKELQCLTVDLKTGDIKTSDAVVLGNTAIKETTCYVVPKPAAESTGDSSTTKASYVITTGDCVISDKTPSKVVPFVGTYDTMKKCQDKCASESDCTAV